MNLNQEQPGAALSGTHPITLQLAPIVSLILPSNLLPHLKALSHFDYVLPLHCFSRKPAPLPLLHLLIYSTPDSPPLISQPASTMRSLLLILLSLTPALCDNLGPAVNGTAATGTDSRIHIYAAHANRLSGRLSPGALSC